jgi:hypothetical protein
MVGARVFGFNEYPSRLEFLTERSQLAIRAAVAVRGVVSSGNAMVLQRMSPSTDAAARSRAARIASLVG